MAENTYNICDPAVQAAFDAYGPQERDALMSLRALIFEVANATPGVGSVQETLKWGQPAYLTPQTKSGTTIRLGAPKSGGVALYTHCQTSVISDFRSLFPARFSFDGNRAVVFPDGHLPPLEQLEPLVRMALTYHLEQ